MLRRASVVGFLCLLLTITGCSGQSPVPAPPIPAPDAPAAPPPPAAEAPLIFTLSPATGAPGSQLTAEVRAGASVNIPLSGPDEKSWYASICWATCDAPTAWRMVPLYPAQNDPRRLTAKVTVPVAVKGTQVGDGAYTVKIACRTKGCEGVPEAATTFRVAGAPAALAWADLAPATVHPLASLSAGGEQDPLRPGRRVTCEGGTTNPHSAEAPPRLKVTADSGATWRTISLAGVALGSQADSAYCRAVSLDPKASDTFYVAGGGSRSAYHWDRDPAPLYTGDGGKSWRRIPTPDGYDQPGLFIGFTVNEQQVTAWFGKRESEQSAAPAAIQGSATADGGKTWRTVPLACPTAAPCAWDVPASEFLQGYRGMLRSEDQGQTWGWAGWAGKRLSALGRSVVSQLAGDTLEIAGACTGGETDRLCAPLLRSKDGGKSWLWVELPPPPDGWDPQPAIWLEPDGSLLLHSKPPGGGWFQLRRGASAWEPAKEPAQPSFKA